MASLREVQDELVTLRKQLEAFHEQAGPDLDLSQVHVFDGDSEAKAAKFREINARVGELARQEEGLTYIKQLGDANSRELGRLTEPVGPVPFANGATRTAPRPAVGFDFRKAVTQNPAWQAFKEGHAGNFSLDLPGLDMKTLVTLTTISPQTVRQPDVVPMALEDRTIADLMMESTIDRGSVEYFEETTFTNAASDVAEGAAKPELTLGYTLRTEVARKIAGNIPVTKEALDDNGFLEGQIRGRLAFAVKRIEEARLLTGTGVAPQILGLLNRVGIQTQARGAESNMDAILRAMQLIRGSAGAGFAEPTGIVIHPANWTTIKLAKTADGIYLWGSPADEGPERLWGKPVRQTTAITSGTALVGAFRPYAEILRREGINVIMSTEHSNFVVLNQVLLQAEERLALAVYRPAAFSTVTGLN